MHTISVGSWSSSRISGLVTWNVLIDDLRVIPAVAAAAVVICRLKAADVYQ